MKTKTITLYTFDELPTEKAKEKAREWFREGNDGSWEWECTIENAKTVGLLIQSLDARRNNEGKFDASAEETAHKIESEHGAACETFKTAKNYLADRDALIEESERDENGDFKDQSMLDDKLDSLDAEFLHSLLEDYRIILEKDLEYAYSAESVDENIRCNEYTFTENGKRES